MSRDRLSELERAWRATGEAADLQRLINEYERTSGLRFANFDLPFCRVAACDPTLIPGAVRESLEEAAKVFDGRALPLQRYEVRHALGHALMIRLGNWFSFGDIWLNWKKAPSAHDIEESSEGITSMLVEQHRVRVRRFLALVELLLPLAATSDWEKYSARVRAAADFVLDLVIAETNCEDSWYGEASDSLSGLLSGLGVVRTDEFDDKVEATFESWICPSREERAEMLDFLALQAVKNKFRERYGDV